MADNDEAPKLRAARRIAKRTGELTDPIIQSFYKFGAIPSEAYGGKYVVPPQTPGTLTEEDVFRSDKARAQEGMDALHLTGYGLAAGGGSMLSRLIPETLPSAVVAGNKPAAPSPAGPPKMAELDDILFGTTPTNTKKPAPGGGLDQILFGDKGPQQDKIIAPDTFHGTMTSDKDVNYDKGAPISTRYSLFKASNPKEQELVLKNAFGEGNYRKDTAGNWVFKQGDQWNAVYPRGVLETMKTGGAFAGAVAPRVAGAAGGAALGAPAGPLGAVAGAMGGAGAATGLEEGLKAARGLYSKTPFEALGEGGGEMLMAGAFQGAGPAFTAGKNAMYGGVSNLAGRFGKITPEAADVGRSLQPYGVPPPFISMVPSARVIEYERTMRNQISGDPMAKPRAGVIDTRINEVLNRFGLTPGEQARAFSDIKTTSEKLSPTAATEKISAAIRGEETALKQTEEQYTGLARKALDDHYNRLVNTQQRIGDRELGATVAHEYEASGQAFRQDMNTAYGAVSQGLGDASVIRLPDDMLRAMDPMSLPAIVRNLTERTEDGELVFRPLSILEAHRLRTAFRDMAGGRVGDQSPLGQKGGDYYRLAGMVDSSIGEFAGQSSLGAGARDALREADRQYAEGVVRFTNEKINNLAWNARQGREPDPDVVANVILNKDSAAATRQLWDMLSPQTRTAVETSDLRNMLEGAADIGKDGRKTVNPDRLIAALNERQHYIPFVHDARMVGEMRRMAMDYKALKGDIDITALPQGGLATSSREIRHHLQEALGARRALAERAAADPATALTSGNTALANAGADHVLSSEARTLQIADRFGISSPEFRDVQKYALVDLLKSAIVPKQLAKGEGLDYTIGSGALERALGKYTDKQQQALFGPWALADVKLLVKQAGAMFPELRHETGTSMAAANIMGHLASKPGLKAYGWYQLWGAIADRPELLKLVTGTIKQDPYAGRGILSWLMQGGAEALLTKSRASKSEDAPFRGFMQPTKKPALPANYGGPVE